MECTLRDKEVQVAHLMACVYDEQNRTQDKQSQVLRLDAERLELGRKLAEMEGLKRLHIGELEARNRAMISELDTARMELDNKIREKRELMQAHAAYVEEMERQHALRVDELDTLVEQYRGTIWQYEAKVEGLEKELEGFKQSSAPRAKVDMAAFASSGADETIDDVQAKNEQLISEYESISNDLELAEGQRDASKREAEALRRDLEAAQAAIAAKDNENVMYRDQVSKLQKEKATGAATSSAPGSYTAPAKGGYATSAGPSATSYSKAEPGSSYSAAPSYGAPASAMASGNSAQAEAMIRQQAAAAGASQEAVAQYDDLRKKLLHTCVELLDEFDDKRVQSAKGLIEAAEKSY